MRRILSLEGQRRFIIRLIKVGGATAIERSMRSMRTPDTMTIQRPFTAATRSNFHTMKPTRDRLKKPSEKRKKIETGNNGPKHLIKRSLAVVIGKPPQLETGVVGLPYGNTLYLLVLKKPLLSSSLGPLVDKIYCYQKSRCSTYKYPKIIAVSGWRNLTY